MPRGAGKQQAGVPSFDAARCLLARVPGSDCAACAGACAVGALSVDDDGLRVDAAACSGCGTCRAACPAQAISLPDLPEPRGYKLWLSCPHTSEGAARATVSCLHGLGLNELAGFWLEGVRELRAVRAPCESCVGRDAVPLAQHLERFNRLLDSHGLERMHLRQVERLPGWPNLLARLSQPAPRTDPRRRALLRGAFSGGDEAAGAPPGPSPLAQVLSRGKRRKGALFPFAPVVAAADCTGCDACWKGCPTGALRIVATRTGATLSTRPELCNGCGFCVDLCDAGAIEIAPLAARTAPVPLEAFTCSGCGAPAHARQGAAGRKPLCTICESRQNRPARVLVLK